MHIRTLVFLVFVPIATCSTGFIITTKVTQSYWRATFSSPPLNIEDTNFFLDLYALIDAIANDTNVKVIVFDSVRIIVFLDS